MKTKIIRIATIVLAFILVGTLTFTAVAEVSSGVESVLQTSYGTPSKYKLSATKYTYNAKEKRPKVVVTNTEGKIIDSANYTVKYKNNIYPGKAVAKVTFKKGTNKELSFTIIPKKAGKPTVKSAKQKQFTVTVKEDKTVSGYEICYSTSKSFKKATKVILGVKTDVRKTITKVKNDKTYYVKVRGYKTVSGKKIYGNWSSTSNVKVKSASAHPNLPDEMIESYVAKSVTYLGYKTAKHIKAGSYMQDYATGPRTPVAYRSKIRYGGGPSGQETVKDKSTVTGRAPNVKKFEAQGMCCASFVSYYYLNYLPNIAGVNTSYIKNAIKKSGMSSQSCASWEWAAKYLVKKGKAKVVDRSSRSLRGATPSKLQIGDLITFSVPNQGVSCGHVAVYAGTNNQGDYYVAHVGSDEGPVFQTLQRFENVVNRYDGCAYSVVYRFDLPQSEYDYDVKLKTTKVKYNGKAQTPKVIVKDAAGKTIASKNYTVYYSNNKKVGTAKVKVIFKGKYKGTKTLKFKIVKK